MYRLDLATESLTDIAAMTGDTGAEVGSVDIAFDAGCGYIDASETGAGAVVAMAAVGLAPAAVVIVDDVGSDVAAVVNDIAFARDGSELADAVVVVTAMDNAWSNAVVDVEAGNEEIVAAVIDIASDVAAGGK